MKSHESVSFYIYTYVYIFINNLREICYLYNDVNYNHRRNNLTDTWLVSMSETIKIKNNRLNSVSNTGSNNIKKQASFNVDIQNIFWGEQEYINIDWPYL